MCWFGQILIVSVIDNNISSLLQKSHFPIRVGLNSLQTQKVLELVLKQFL